MFYNTLLNIVNWIIFLYSHTNSLVFVHCFRRLLWHIAVDFRGSMLKLSTLIDQFFLVFLMSEVSIGYFISWSITNISSFHGILDICHFGSLFLVLFFSYLQTVCWSSGACRQLTNELCLFETTPYSPPELANTRFAPLRSMACSDVGL